MAWREDLHPRDDQGRFTRKGSLPTVSIKATVGNLRMASDSDLLDVFHRLSAAKRLDKRALAAIDAELTRRDAGLEEPDDSPESQALDDLVARGYPYHEAYAEVYGARAGRGDQGAVLDRRRGETLEQARRRAYAEMVALQSLQAEEATRGHLTSKRCPGVDPASLWSGPAPRARKCASEELLRWWDEHGGRRTYTEFRATLVGTSTARRSAQHAKLAGSGRDFGV